MNNKILDEENNNYLFIEKKYSLCECCIKKKPNVKWFKRCINNMPNKYSICKSCEKNYLNQIIQNDENKYDAEQIY